MECGKFQFILILSQRVRICVTFNAICNYSQLYQWNRTKRIPFLDESMKAFIGKRSNGKGSKLEISENTNRLLRAHLDVFRWSLIVRAENMVSSYTGSWLLLKLFSHFISLLVLNQLVNQIISGKCSIHFFSVVYRNHKKLSSSV